MPDSDALIAVNRQAREMAVVDDQCEKGYARLGWLLLEVAEMQYWKVKYATFKEYLNTVSQISKKTTAQLQRYFLTVRDLSDVLTLEQLERMGISKAMKLRIAKDYALILPKEVIDAALDPKTTVADLKKVISISLKMPEEEGDWMDCEMEFMVDPEQRATIEQAIEAARHTEPLTKSTISKSAQMLDVMMKFSQEFLGAHSGDGQ